MRTIAPALWTIALLLPVVSIDAQADLRCKNDLARPGDSKASVLMKCGEPVAKESFCKPVPQSTTLGPDNRVIVNTAPCEMVDDWTYNPGSGEFFTTLRFENGVLKSMKYGDRVP
jgi:uncharacterized protein DUF2845